MPQRPNSPLRIPRAQYPGRAYPYPPVPVYPNIGQPGGTPPFIPSPPPVAAPMPDPNQPPGATPVPTSVGPGGAQSRLMEAIKDPRFTQFLLAAGAQMGQPLQPGQTGWGRMAQSVASGYNTLAMHSAMVAEREREAAQLKRQQAADQREETRLGLEQQRTEAGIKDAQEGRTIQKEQVAQQKSQFEVLRGLDDKKLGLEIKRIDNDVTQFKDRLAFQEKELAQRKAEFGSTQAYRDKELQLQKDRLTLQEKEAAASMAKTYADIKRINEQIKNESPDRPMTPQDWSSVAQRLGSYTETIQSSRMMGLITKEEEAEILRETAPAMSRAFRKMMAPPRRDVEAKIEEYKRLYPNATPPSYDEAEDLLIKMNQERK